MNLWKSKITKSKLKYIFYSFHTHLIHKISSILVSQYLRHNLGYKQKKQAIRRNQVYFSSSSVSTDTTVIVKDYMLSEGLISAFQEFFASINKTFISVGGLGSRLLFYAVLRLSLYLLIS